MTVLATSSEQVEFRLGTATDALTVGMAATHVFLDTYATGGLTPVLAREAAKLYSAEAFLQRLNDAATTFVLAERDKHLLGFAEFTRDRACPGPGVESTVELVRLYVLPMAQGKGLGSALLQRVEALLTAERGAGIWLTAWSGNLRALGFYPAQGYRVVGSTSYVIEGIAYDNRVFAKALPQRHDAHGA